MEESKTKSVGLTLMEGQNRAKAASSQSQFLFQNVMLLIKFHASGKFSVPSRIYNCV